MIPRKKTQNQTKSYFSDPLELLKQLNLSAEQVGFSALAAKKFRFKVPVAFVSKIKVNDAQDPLLRQILPVQQETDAAQGYSDDPLSEAQSEAQPGLLQKYHGRALLLVTPNCVIHCRYCFRRHYPYEDKAHFWQQLKKNIAQISQNNAISEVILSGGDPLSLSDRRLSELFSLLQSIPHLKRIRIHTRFAVVEPKRITDRLLNLLSACSLQIIMVLHINHAQEIGVDTHQVFAQLAQRNILLFNQSVLLAGVNDNVATLIRLSEKLVENHVIPYYLHTLDRVTGSHHFEVSMKDAKTIYQKLREQLPGYMLPRLVCEIPGEKCKIPIEIGA